MNIIHKKSFIIFIIPLFFIAFVQTTIVEATELDLMGAQNAVGKRFASKFCEVKEKGFSIESSSEFALNNTYLKFVAFPDDDKFVKDLWKYTIDIIHKECGNYLTDNEEINLREFFQEEGKIASNRNLYLPN